MGKLIVIDGLDGSGKATQTELLIDNLKKIDHNIIKVTFPNYKDDSSALIKMYLNGEFGTDPQEINPFAASSFYAVDRYASYKKYWEKQYLDGHTIVCDRYVTSNLIHQMVKLPVEKWDEFINWLEDYEYSKLKLPKPDVVIYLDLDLSISQQLINNRCNSTGIKKDIHEKDLVYLKKCQKAARYMSNLENWIIIKCNDDYGNLYKKEYLGMEILKKLIK